LRCCERRQDRNPSGAVEVVALEPAQCQSDADEVLQQERADMRFVLAPANTPIAAEHRVAAVLSPRTLKPSRKIRPAPMKPMPETTWAATRVGLLSLGKSASKTTKVADPSATSVLVRNPASRLRHCRAIR
jgi:hypothetical protein